MIHFINLTSRVINKLHIIEILNKYCIHMSGSSINGILLFENDIILLKKK
jgi:hypothetical protein